MNAERRPAVKNRRTILSVAFDSADFQSVAHKAQSEGKTVSKYVRDLALRDCARPTWHLLLDGESVHVSNTS